MIDYNNIKGAIPVYKPSGLFSSKVTAFFKKAFSNKVKVGHVGTLDPLAEGVLVILLGKATRLQDLLLESPKTYRCTIRLGVHSDTLDADGKIIEEASFDHVTREALEDAAKTLEGEMWQAPPLYSAAKVDGRPLYWYARNNKAFLVDEKIKTKKITVHSFEILSFEKPYVEFLVVVSNGTYVRVLSDMLARKVETLGMVTKLIREKASGFEVQKIQPLEFFQKISMDEITSNVVPLEQLELPRSTVLCTNSQLETLLMGQYVSVIQTDFKNTNCNDSQCVLKDLNGKIIGLVEMVTYRDDLKLWHFIRSL